MPYSSGQGGNCVEVATLDGPAKLGATTYGGLNLVRDSKSLDRAVLKFARDEWNVFTAAIKNGSLATRF
ncbi:DUF397 domain-containing protein [Sphaerisporangium sp. NPDC051011]|uniref:DUF397 domain-containing protein n=1 Tax=Sphaerisporangium sp. NPDC051011 TaxID=3155792 RepID=UPI0033EEAA0F